MFGSKLGRVAVAGMLALMTAACAETDTGITTSVRARLAADDMVKTARIDVDTTESVVTLRGEVESVAARDRAVELARNTDGVRDVVDRLELGPRATATSGGEATQGEGHPEAETDEAKGRDSNNPTANAVLTSKVKTKLLADTNTSGLRIDVDSKDGVVTLTGTVPSAAEKNRALELARETEGVKSVLDRLKVGR